MNSLKNKLHIDNHDKNRMLEDIKNSNDLRSQLVNIDKELIRKEYLLEIKNQVNNNTARLKIEQKLLDNKIISEELEKDKLIKKELEEKLPIIQSRQIEANMKYIDNMKYKEKQLLEKLESKRKLEEITLNLKSRPIVHADPNRLLLETEALNIRRNKIQNNEMDNDDKGHAFRNINGFSNSDIMKDYRFKLQTYMNENGVNPSSSKAANDYLNSLINANKK